MAPTADQIKQTFAPLGERDKGSEFFDHVSDDVKWTVIGHTSISGVYTNKQAFVDATLSLLRDRVLTEALRIEVFRVIGGGPDSDWAAVQLRAAEGTRCKNGLPYDMQYCWTCRFGKDGGPEEGKIVEVIAYLDTDLLSRAIAENP